MNICSKCFCIFAEEVEIIKVYMARPKQNRKIAAPPIMSGFKPFGIPRNELEEIVLQYDEYEALRLLDYEGMLQEEAAEQMNVSRPTLTRIYNSARKIIAQAFVEGKMIVIDGGSVDFGKEWYRCGKCHQLTDNLSVRHSNCGGRRRRLAKE